MLLPHPRPPSTKPQSLADKYAILSVSSTSSSRLKTNLLGLRIINASLISFPYLAFNFSIRASIFLIDITLEISYDTNLIGIKGKTIGNKANEDRFIDH